MRIPRFRVRTLMIAVAVVAVALGAGRRRQRAPTFLQRAAEFAERETTSWLMVEASCRRNPLPGLIVVHEDPMRHRWWALYLGRLRRKYERAARYPWLPVPPDPPPPE